MSPCRLRDPARNVSFPLRAGIALSLFVLWGCGRDTPPGRTDSVPSHIAPVGGPSRVKPVDSGWNTAAGPALLVQGGSRDEAVALFPSRNDSDAVARLDSVSLAEVPVILFGRGGLRFSAQLGAPTGDGTTTCERWQLHTFQPVAPGSWSVGFVSDRVRPLALDSVAVLSARDSMSLVAEASRLASSITISTTGSFQGLRFTVEDLRRFDAAPGVQAIVAHLVRRINQEANPQEEQTFLVAERDSGMTSGPYHVAYAHRTSGREDELVTPEVLAGVRIGADLRPTLVVARDGNEGIAYLLLERIGARHWRIRWSSGSTNCS